MPVKKVEVASIGTVSLYKRRGARNVRLSIAHDGEVRVTLPTWAPYKVALDFLQSRLEWVSAQRTAPSLLTDGFDVGKAHHIKFASGPNKSISTRTTGNEIRVMLPQNTSWDDDKAQQAAKKAAVRALKSEAATLLSSRVKQLAQQYDFSYRSVTIKQLKGRWGSCSEQKDIVLNCYLMQLPWELIDYVILHELVHTKVMAHGPRFWDQMSMVCANVTALRKQIKTHKPVL